MTAKKLFHTYQLLLMIGEPISLLKLKAEESDVPCNCLHFSLLAHLYPALSEHSDFIFVTAVVVVAVVVVVEVVQSGFEGTVAGSLGESTSVVVDFVVVVVDFVVVDVDFVGAPTVEQQTCFSPDSCASQKYSVWSCLNPADTLHSDTGTHLNLKYQSLLIHLSYFYDRRSGLSSTTQI